MNRMWEIREGYDSDRKYGMRSAEDKAYECGFEDGYRKAMEEIEMYTQTGKNPHDDSVDSLVQLLQLIEHSSSKVQIINSPF